MNLSAARAGLKTALEGAQGLSGKTFAYEPAQITPPSAWVTNSAVDYRVDMGQEWAMRVTFRVTVVVRSGNTESAQTELDGYLATTGTKSLPLAIHADPTLGGTVDFVDAIEVADAGLIEVGGLEYVGARLVVEAMG